jgi:hypothetical protein
MKTKKDFIMANKSPKTITMFVFVLVAYALLGYAVILHNQPFFRDWFEKPAGACVVHACEECAKHADAKILMVRYKECELGHAYCVYTESGQLYAWDWRGRVAMDTIPDYADDAYSVAMWLTIIDPPVEAPVLSVRSAAYEWSSRK